MISVTPFLAQSSNSPFLMAREALVKSGVSSPRPEQNSLKPPPVPVACGESRHGGERHEAGGQEDAFHVWSLLSEAGGN
jgi:hypothetical protein